MILVTVLSYFFAALCIASAIYVAFSKNRLRTTIAFFLEIASASGILLSLDADYLALTVLALALLGTVLVISFSSVIMGSLKVSARKSKENAGKRVRLASVLGLAVGLASGAALAWAFLSDPFLSRLKGAVPPANGPAEVHILGKMMLGSQLVMFEVLAVVVLVVVIGAGLLLRKTENGR